MKIKMDYDDETGAWFEGGDYAVELPDAIVKDWRETQAHLKELYAYFTEKAEPQIKAERDRRIKEWRRTHPEEAKRRDAIIKMWTRPIFEKVAGDRIYYGGKKLKDD